MVLFCTSLASTTNPHGYLTPLHHSQTQTQTPLTPNELPPTPRHQTPPLPPPQNPKPQTPSPSPPRVSLPQQQPHCPRSPLSLGPLRSPSSPKSPTPSASSATSPPLSTSPSGSGDLAHTACLHVKESDTVFVAGSLRSDLSHLNASEGGETSLQVKVHALNFVEESYPVKKLTKFGSEEMTLDFAVPSEKDDVNESSKDIHAWKDLLAKTHECWDVRSKEGSRKAFERKSNGELRMVDDSTSKWIKHQLDSLTFDQKPISHGSETSLEKDEATTLGTWRDLLDNPKQWKDYRDQKLNKLVKKNYPDFKHKDGGHALWLDKVPLWVLSELEGLEFDFPIKMSKQEKERRGDKAWKDLVENPEKWWDNRLDKVITVYLVRCSCLIAAKCKISGLQAQRNW